MLLLLTLACAPERLVDSGQTLCSPVTEVCDGVDNDCDGLVDDVDPGIVGLPACDGLTDGRDGSLSDGTTWYADVDGDEYGDPDNVSVACSAPSGFIAEAGDCDDGWTQVNPDALEICDGSDNDCDTLVDGDDDSLSDGTNFYADLDGDGYGDATNPILECTLPSGYVVGASDCDDTVATVRPCGNCAATASSPGAWELDVPADGEVTIDADLDGTTVDDTSLVV